MDEDSEMRMTLRLSPSNYKHLSEESRAINISLNGMINNILARYFGLTAEKWNVYNGSKNYQPPESGEEESHGGEDDPTSWKCIGSRKTVDYPSV